MQENEQLNSRELADLLREAADDRQAWETVILDIQGLTTIADYFVVCEGETDRQVKAIADAMVEAARERRVRPLAIDGYDEATWVLLDFDSVVAHVFLPGERNYYDLEALWDPARAQPRPGIAEDVEPGLAAEATGDEAAAGGNATASTR